MRNHAKQMTLLELVISIFVILLLIVILLPAFIPTPRHHRIRAKCSNNLRNIGYALILYSDDHSFLPHMNKLDKAHSIDDKDAEASRVFRTLHALKYLDGSEIFVCPNSDDTFVDYHHSAPEVLDNPKLFSFTDKANEASAEKPILKKTPGDVPVFQNKFLSYTYRRTSQKTASLRQGNLLAADKALREPQKSPTVGNHEDGFNVLYGDTSVKFCQKEDDTVMQALQKRLAMGSFHASTNIK